MKAIQDETTLTNDAIDEKTEKKVKKKKRKRTSNSKRDGIDEDNGDDKKVKNDNNGIELDETKNVHLVDDEKEVTAVIETNKDIHSDADDDDDNDDDPTTKSKRKRKRKRKSKSESANDATSSSSKPIFAEAHDSKVASLDRTVYVEGLPFDATESDVRDWFATRIKADDDDNDVEELRLATWHDTGRLRGYGHVVFTKSRDKALACHGETMGKRYLTIVPAKAPKLVPTINASSDVTTSTTGSAPPTTNSGSCRVVFVKNLPYHATEDDILQSFQVCGKILDGGIRIARHSNNTTQSKGFAYVEYKNPEGAQGAVEKASKPFGLSVLGRPVFVDYDDKGGRMKGSYKLVDGRLWTKQYGAKK